MVELIARASAFTDRTAIKDHTGTYSYSQLLSASEAVAHKLLQGSEHLNESCVAFLMTPGMPYVSVQWGIWRAGGIAVPICEKHPLPSIRYVLDDAEVSIFVYSRDFEELLSPLFHRSDIQFIAFETKDEVTGSLPVIDSSQAAMILYTSGTTGAPKGVVTTHDIIAAQIQSLVTAWEWQADDHILNVLPLHHLHGIVNILCCALWSGACCEFLPKFEPRAVMERFKQGEINVFMAVPTIYFKLISYYEGCPPEEQHELSAILKSFRLMVSGSAALPVSVLEQWKAISNHTLLERYGMTEIGMAISNPYRGERRPGFIGQPLNGVNIRIANESDLHVPDGTQGEIQVKGATVFLEYYNRPEATVQSFTTDGWFRSGDIAVVLDGSYKILGRNSVDIIKSGGYKISALEIEEVLRTHPAIKDCAVVGIPDLEWGERIAAGLIKEDGDLNVEDLKAYTRSKLPDYKVPRQFLILEDLPRNVMGKVTKTALKDLF